MCDLSNDCAIRRALSRGIAIREGAALTANAFEPKINTGISHVMGQEMTHFAKKRRFPRARGPFDGYQGGPHTPVLIYDLNVGGGFVNFGNVQPTEVDFELTVALPFEGLVTVSAETVYRHESGVAVRFVNVDSDTVARLARAVDAAIQQTVLH